MTHSRKLAWAATAAVAFLSAAAAPSTVPATGPTTAPATRPDYAAFTQTAALPYSKPLDFDRLGYMGVRVSIDGGPPLTLQLDTGSVGVIVGATDCPHFDPDGPPGNIVYVSSGNELDGVWNTVTLTFVDSRGPDGKPVRATLPVLAATGYQFHPGAVNGGTTRPKPATAPATAATRRAATRPARPLHPNMMGVGFARGKDGHPERNPFLNLTAMQAGTMRRGYALTRDGVTLGLDPHAAADYVFEKLVERPVSPETARLHPDLRDWRDGQGAVVVGDAPPVPVGILMDTGLTNFMLELPAANANADVPAGTPVSVGLLGGRLGYRFTVGDKADPSAPRRVTYTHKDDFALLNTGLKSLAGFDYLYDADGGYLALRPTRVHP